MFVKVHTLLMGMLSAFALGTAVGMLSAFEQRPALEVVTRQRHARRCARFVERLEIISSVVPVG